MKALITGASSGFGKDMAYKLSQMGYDIIAVARREDKLIELKNELKTEVIIKCLDVTTKEGIKEIEKLLDECDVFINNAGFGVFGKFTDNDLQDELRMLDTNVYALHILTKIAVKKFKEKNRGHILNVASIAAFFPGPLFAAYYAGKSYVLRLTQAVYEELRQEKSNVKISVLCPGPSDTEFGSVAKVKFGKGNEKGRDLVILPSKKIADYAVRKMFEGKLIIIPGFLYKVAVFLRRFLSEKMLCKLLYKLQNSKFTY